MLSMLLQLEMLLAALSAFMPLVPEEQRDRAAKFLAMAANAVTVGVNAATNLDDLAEKLALVRGEVEAMAAGGRNVTADELDAAMTRVRAASAAFRVAAEAAEAGQL